MFHPLRKKRVNNIQTMNPLVFRQGWERKDTNQIQTGHTYVREY